MKLPPCMNKWRSSPRMCSGCQRWHPLLSIAVHALNRQGRYARQALVLMILASTVCPRASDATPSDVGQAHASSAKAPVVSSGSGSPAMDWPVSQTVGELMQREAQTALQHARQMEREREHQTASPARRLPPRRAAASPTYGTDEDRTHQAVLLAIYGLAPTLTVELRESGQRVRFQSGQQTPILGHSHYRLLQVKDNCAVFQQGHATRRWCLGVAQTSMERP